MYRCHVAVLGLLSDKPTRLESVFELWVIIRRRVCCHFVSEPNSMFRTIQCQCVNYPLGALEWYVFVCVCFRTILQSTETLYDIEPNWVCRYFNRRQKSRIRPEYSIQNRIRHSQKNVRLFISSRIFFHSYQNDPHDWLIHRTSICRWHIFNWLLAIGWTATDVKVRNLSLCKECWIQKLLYMSQRLRCFCIEAHVFPRENQWCTPLLLNREYIIMLLNQNVDQSIRFRKSDYIHVNMWKHVLVQSTQFPVRLHDIRYSQNTSRPHRSGITRTNGTCVYSDR